MECVLVDGSSKTLPFRTEVSCQRHNPRNENCSQTFEYECMNLVYKGINNIIGDKIYIRQYSNLFLKSGQTPQTS
jgi:hypothetical protein